MSAWRLKLECGHHSDDMSGDEAERLLAGDQQAVCSVCHVMRATTGGLKHGGLSGERSMAKWEKRTKGVARHRAIEAKAWEQPIVRPDGLVLRRSGPTRYEWWCRWCDGMADDVERWQKGKARLDLVAREWDSHIHTRSHLRNLSLSPEGMAVAAEKVNRQRRPPTAS